MSDTIIKIEQLSKLFSLGASNSGSFRETLSSFFRGLMGKTNSNAKKEFWALRDVSFDVKQGEVIGILGRNGAGKSTLLKILSRISPPTKGRIEITGRIASLLEVGTGFHPELTGRENIFLNGSILGMTRSEIRRKFDEIVAFSEIEKFLDTPVKHYSSGMYVRLAFAVAAHLEPEILVVDEVLAVGDAEFQKKCLGKMNDVAGGGRTVLFVSHNMGAVRDLCKRGIVLRNGEKVMDGDINECVNYYLKSGSDGEAGDGEIRWSEEKAPSKTGEFKLLAVRMYDHENKVKSVFSYEEKIFLEIDYLLTQRVTDMRVNIHLLTNDNAILFVSSTDGKEPHEKMAGTYRCKVELPQRFFNAGTFKVLVHSGQPTGKELLEGIVTLHFDVEKYTRLSIRGKLGSLGYTAPALDWSVTQL